MDKRQRAGDDSLMKIGRPSDFVLSISTCLDHVHQGGA
jgi:hypothetical protein